MTGRAWLFNLDAEEELAHPRTYAGPFAALEARPELREPLSALLEEGDIALLRDGTAEGREGRAWSPTPRALQALRERGATCRESPTADVLSRVSRRSFCAALGLSLELSLFTADVGEAERHLDGPAPPSGRWLCRKELGFAGRGRLVQPAGRATKEARGFLEAACASGGALIEPWVDRLLDVSLHGFIGPDGALTSGSPCVSTVDAGGVWRATRRALSEEVLAEELAALARALEASGAALHRAGYFGPFGIDGFRHRWAPGEPARFNPRCELNARYSMGWAVGMGENRPDLRP